MRPVVSLRVVETRPEPPTHPEPVTRGAASHGPHCQYTILPAPQAQRPPEKKRDSKGFLRVRVFSWFWRPPRTCWGSCVPWSWTTKSFELGGGGEVFARQV
ncbi:unnamed protein product [Rangifer tarandus platyrhynchus]|uniref:Uncharacterized protein n=2 Tax=Rangifer tarandus platyrhynchus TaxID=3082113 RepID=A0AC60A9Y5_RANTA|nr:unnamed protein product [Rangifer tarandus platyrhynchus]